MTLTPELFLIYSKHVVQNQELPDPKNCVREASATSIRLAMTLAKYLVGRLHYYGLCEEPFGGFERIDSYVPCAWDSACEALPAG